MHKHYNAVRIVSGEKVWQTFHRLASSGVNDNLMAPKLWDVNITTCRSLLTSWLLMKMLLCKCGTEARCSLMSIAQLSPADTPCAWRLLLTPGRYKTLVHPLASLKQVQAISSFREVTSTLLRIVEVPVVPEVHSDSLTGKNAKTCTTSSNGLRSNLGPMAVLA